MNINKSLMTRIEQRLTETKNPCKNYATEAAAEKATSEVAMKAAEYFTIEGNSVRSARYVVMYIPSWGRWIGAVDMTELLGRRTSTGGYLGICGDFYTF